MDGLRLGLITEPDSPDTSICIAQWMEVEPVV